MNCGAGGGNPVLVRRSSIRWQVYVPDIHHFVELGGGVGSHTYMVFLSVAGYYGVAAGGITVHFILAYHAGRPHIGES